MIASFPDMPEQQCVDYERDNLDFEPDLDYHILPKWLLQRQDMIFPYNRIEKKEMLGHGQYGTVNKGIFHHGNAM